MTLAPGSRVGPYEIVSSLGAGGMGQVYLAEDTRLGRKVALKTLAKSVTPDSERRFEREARAASALNHPNIVTIHEIGEAAFGRFLVMEFVEGRTLRSLLFEGATPERLPALGRQMAKALAAAHERGIVHRDIKPENIIVREDGQLKILDFGLAQLLAVPSDITETGVVLGTVNYMAPEQARGEPTRSAGDIFALGLIFYELATGRHPFATGQSKIGVLHAIVSQPALKPSALNPEVPAAVDALILQMLEKDYRRRPSAQEVDRALAAIEVWKLEPSPRLVPRARRHTVGRVEERAQLEATYLGLSRGRGLLVGVAADAGVGKTTFVEEFLTEVGDQACFIARGCCSERLSGSDAYLPFLEAIDDLLHGPDGPSVARVAKAMAPSWYLQVVPAADESSSGERLLAERATSQERMKMEIASLFRELVRLKPLVLFFEDLHWADASTVDLLSYLASRLDAMPVLMLVTFRPTELHIARHPFLQIKSNLQAHGIYREMELGLLSRADVEGYLALEFPEHRFPASVCELVYARTEGNALFMCDLVQYLRDRGLIGERDGVWQLLRPIGDLGIKLPDNVQGMIQHKIDQVPEDDRQLLQAASVQGYEFDSAVLAQFTKRDSSSVEERLEALERMHGLIRSVGEFDLPDRSLNVRYQFAHVLYQNVLYESLRPTRRAAMSAALARTLLSCYGEQHATIASQVAQLFEVARDYEAAARYFLLAAQNALRVFAHEEVALLARHGLALLGEVPQSRERATSTISLQFMLASAVTGRLGFSDPETRAAFDRLHELTQQTGNEPECLPALVGMFFYDLVRANLDLARRTAEQLVQVAETGRDAIRLVGAYYALGQVLNFLGDLHAALDYEERSIALHQPAFERPYRAVYPFNPGLYAMVDSARTLFLLGYPDRALRRANEAVEEALAINDVRSIPQVLLLAAAQHIFRREPQRVGERLRGSLDYCERLGLPLEAEWARFVQAWAAAKLGSSAEGIAQMRSSFEKLETLHARVGVKTYFGLLLAEVLMDVDGLDEAQSLLESGLAFAASSGDRQWEAEQHRLLGEVCRSKGADSAADSCFRTALAVARRQSALALELRAATSLVRLHGDEASGAALTEVLGRFTEGVDLSDLREARALVAQSTTM